MWKHHTDWNSKTFVNYYGNLKQVMQDVLACNLLNYNETNLLDKVETKKQNFKGCVKYPEWIIN